MTAPDSVRELVERFDQHRDAYRAGKYNETQLRNEFLNPFFEALGWDVLNKLGYSEENKHVIHEDSLEIEGMKKAPDYAFKVGKERKFFVEAKKPFVKIETNPEVAFQLKRYVWSAKLPLGILTDFEEFAVYECRSKPKVSDSVKTGRVMLLNYSEYIEKWDEIVSIFSHDAVMTGGFDKFAKSVAKKKGTAEIDAAFLDEIEGWREALAKNVALRNKPQIKSEADLNYSIQMTIDRMIFLRICEDRGYESEFQLQNIAYPLRPAGTSPKSERASDLGEEGRVYGELKKLFERADRRYNSGLFHFKDEKGRGRADTFTTGLEIDDKVLKDIIKDLYYPAPYVFALIPADILGQIYEQFLGKVIRLTAGGNAKVEEKPEVRKAGGVYYTPTFIVSTIVINTLGKLLNPTPPLAPPHPSAIAQDGEGKMTPKEAAKLKLVDPACGSGTFLLGAYQYLLDWHLDWYMNNDFEKWSKGRNAVLVQSKDSWKLSVEKKKEILLNNIFGVDIDPQAVEVTKLSLLLKVIEDPGQLSYLDERILPDLGGNIQCGNSLISSDYFEGQLMVSEEERARVNAFDWKSAFPEVFAQGGFDAVVGNPPYVRQEELSDSKKYFKQHYKTYVPTADLYVSFIEKAMGLLKPNGLFGMIVSNKWLRAAYGEPLRKFLTSNSTLLHVIDLAGLPVFEGATVRTIVLICSPIPNAQKIFNYLAPLAIDDFRNIQSGNDLQNIFEQNATTLSIDDLSSDSWSFTNSESNGVMSKIQNGSTPITEYINGKLYFGIKTGFNKAFVLDKKTRDELIKKDARSEEIIKPLLAGRDVKRYSVAFAENYLIWTYIGVPIENYPAIFEHLKQYQTELQKRWDKGNYWWELRACDYYDKFVTPKIIYPDIATACRFYLDEESCFGINTTYFIPSADRYLLGILNSKLGQFFFTQVCAGLEGGGTIYLRFFGQYIQNFPVHLINHSDPAEKAQHDKMVSLVERMLALQKSLKSTVNPQEADRLAREVESTDRAIDRLVYELYGLTEDEIGIVES